MNNISLENTKDIRAEQIYMARERKREGYRNKTNTDKSPGKY